jgi:hypothetical protein
MRFLEIRSFEPSISRIALPLHQSGGSNSRILNKINGDFYASMHTVAEEGSLPQGKMSIRGLQEEMNNENIRNTHTHANRL